MASNIWTLGDRNINLTFGLGYYNMTKMVSSRLTTTNIIVSERKTFASGLLTLSAMTRLTKKTFLMTENWMVRSPELNSLYSLGIRMAGAKFMFDFSMIYVSKSFDNFYPVIGFSYKF